MTKKNIEYLETCVNSPLLQVWYRANNGWRKIHIIAGHPDEPELVGFFFDGTGHYVALLAAVTLADIMVTTLDLAKWPEQE